MYTVNSVLHNSTYVTIMDAEIIHFNNRENFMVGSLNNAGVKSTILNQETKATESAVYF